MTNVILACVFIAGLIAAGVAFAALGDAATRASLAGRPVLRWSKSFLPEAPAAFVRQRIVTERPDAFNWHLSPGLYLSLGLVGLSIIPFGPGLALVDTNAGIVVWGACEALTIVVIFLHGWSANAPFPLLGAYRYVAIGLPVMLLSMFVLIAAAMPAESLALPAIVEAQRGVWNVVRQPLGLLLFLMLGLAVTLRGPFDYASPFDLAGGVVAESSGPLRASWEFARLVMLVSFSAMASTAFLGGYLGPWLPGALWLLIKTLFVIALLIVATHWFARLPPSRMLTALWILLLPLSFFNLALVGAELLL